MVKLRECPNVLCQGLNIEFFYMPDGYAISCKDCACMSDIFYTKREVVEFWNNRPEEKLFEALKKEIKQQIEEQNEK